MGLLSGLLGNASSADAGEIEKSLERILADGERVEQAFQLVRDLLIFTDRRFIIIEDSFAVASGLKFLLESAGC